MQKVVWTMSLLVFISCDTQRNSETPQGSNDSPLSMETAWALPPGFPVSHVICADSSYIRLLAYPNGRMYVDGAILTTPAGQTAPETRFFFYGEPEIPADIERSGFNILPFVGPSKNVEIPLRNTWCRTSDGSRTCRFKRGGIVLEPYGNAQMMVRPDIEVEDDPATRVPFYISNCRNNAEDTGLRAAITNGFSWKPYTVSQGMIASLFGNNLAESTQTASWEDGKLPTRLSDVNVFIDGQAAQLFFVSPSQVNILVPTTLDTTLDVHRIEVRRGPGWLAAKGTFFLRQAAIGIHPTAFYWTEGAYVSVAVTGIAQTSLSQIRFMLNDRVVEPDTKLYDWLGDAPGYVGYQQLNINVKIRMTDEEMGNPMTLQIVPEDGASFAESNSITLTPP